MTQVAGEVITCPGCGTNYKNKPEWAGRTVKCKCGAVLPTGAKPAMPKAAMAAAAAIPTKPQLTRARATMEESGTSNGMKIGIIVGAVVLVIGAIVGFKMLQGPSGPDPATLKGDDARVIAWMDDDGFMEAKEWVGGHSQRMVAGWTNQKAMKYVEEFYGMGAKRVIVRGQGHMTMEMAIELPADKPSRDKILFWANNFYGLTRGTGANMIKDEGQSWVSVRPGMGG